MSDKTASAKPTRCPRCDSPAPNLHPAMQFEGEVQICRHPWHAPFNVQIPSGSFPKAVSS